MRPACDIFCMALEQDGPHDRSPQASGAVTRLAEMLRACERAVVFTGAGISTESGIPDFRSPGGIWTKMSPIDFDAFVSSAEMRREAWRRRFAMEEMFASVKPNAGHSEEHTSELQSRFGISYAVFCL